MGPLEQRIAIEEEREEQRAQLEHERRQEENPKHDREAAYWRCIDCGILGLTQYLLAERFGPVEWNE